jgi:hypothetical protein
MKRIRFCIPAAVCAALGVGLGWLAHHAEAVKPI